MTERELAQAMKDAGDMVLKISVAGAVIWFILDIIMPVIAWIGGQ